MSSWDDFPEVKNEENAWDKFPEVQTLSRKDMSNLGVTEKTNARQRQVITQALKRNIYAVGVMGGFDPGITKESLKAYEPERPRTEEARDALARGLASTGSGLLQGFSGTMTTMPAGPFGPRIEPQQVEKEKKQIQKQAKLLWDVSRDPELAAQNKDIASKAINIIGETVPYITATTASYMLAGPAGGFATGAMVEGNSAYREALDSGVNEKKAKSIGVGVGIVSGAIEAVGGKYAEQLLVKAASKIKNRFLKAGVVFSIGSAIEALEEGSQEIAQITGESTYRDVDWKAAVSRTLSAMGGGLFLGGLFRGVSATSRGVVDFGANKELNKVAKELGVPIKGLTPEAAVEKIDAVLRNRQALERDIGETTELTEQQQAVKALMDSPFLTTTPTVAVPAPQTPVEARTPAEGGVEAAQPNRYEGLDTSAKEALLKQIYGREGTEVVVDKKIREYYKELKASFTSEEAEEFKAVTGILDKRIATVEKQEALGAKPKKGTVEERKLRMEQAAYIPEKGELQKMQEPAEIETAESKRTLDAAMNDAVSIVMEKAGMTAKQTYRKAQKDLISLHKDMLDYAKRELPEEYNLLKRAATRIVKSRTPSQIKAVEPAIRKMVEQYEKAQAIKQTKDAIKQARERNLKPEFEKMLKGIEGISLKTSREETIKRMESLIKAAEIDEAEMEVGEIPQRLIDKAMQVLADTTKPTLADFSTGELEVLSDAIGNVIAQDTLKKELLFTKSKRTAQEHAQEATTKVEERWGKKHEVETGKFDKKGLKRSLRKGWEAVKRITHWDQLNIRTKSRILGGRGSVAEKLLSDNLAEGDRFTTEVQMDSLRFVKEQEAKLGIDNKAEAEMSEKMGDKKAKIVSVELPEARAENGQRVKNLEMTLAEMGAIHRFLQDPENKAALLKNRCKGITFARDESATAIKLTAKDLQAIEDQTPINVKILAERMVDYVNDQAPGYIAIGQKVKDVWQTLMGYPLRTHDRYVARRRSGEHRQYDPTHTTKNYVESRLERMPQFQKRTESTAPFVIGDMFAEFHADVNRMAVFAGKALAVHDAKVLLKDIGFRRSVKNAFKHGDALLTDLEKTVEFYQGLDQPFQGDLETFAKGLIRRAHIGALALKPQIILYQTVSLLNANAAGMDAKYLYNPKHYRISEYKRIRGILNKHSALMEARDKGGSYQIMTPASAGSTLKQMYGHEGRHLKGIHGADGKVMELIGLAAEAEGKAQGKTGQELNEYIARRTEYIVRESQPSWDATTLSTLAREGRQSAWKHLLVMFTSQRNKNLNMATNSVVDYMFSSKSAGEKAKMAKGVLIPTIANAALIYAMSEGIAFLLTGAAQLAGYNPKDKDKKWADHIAGITERLLGNWIIVGDLVSSLGINIYEAAGGKPSLFKRHRGTILFEATGQAIAASMDLTRAIIQTIKDEEYGPTSPKAGQKKNVESFSKALEEAGRAAGVFTGLPLQGILQMVSPFMPHRQEAQEEPLRLP